jgi:hypothetical protein
VDLVSCQESVTARGRSLVPQGETTFLAPHETFGKEVRKIKTRVLTRSPIFGWKLNSPELARIEQFNPNSPSLASSGLPQPHDLKLPNVIAVFGADRDHLAQGILPLGLEGRPEFADAEGDRVFAELVSLCILSRNPDGATELEPR